MCKNANFQLNISERVGEKNGKMHISYILSTKIGIIPPKIDAKWWHMNCITFEQSHVKDVMSELKKRNNSYKNLRKVTKPKLYL